MIRVTTGHFANGNWRLKQEDGIVFLAHIQPFNRDTEYRIGPDQVNNIQIEEQTARYTLVKINFKEDRYCRAKVPTDDMKSLLLMEKDIRTAPPATSQQSKWVWGMCVFFLICIIFEIVK